MSDIQNVRPLLRPASASRPRRVFVRDLLLSCLIGVHRHERDGKQRVRINLDMEITESGGPVDDRLANVVSYETIVEGIRQLVAAEHVNLVETMAERIAQLCLVDHRVLKATVRVEKLDVFSDAAGVGVEIERFNSKTQ